MEHRVEICTMQAEQIPFGMSLKEAAGWNQLPLDWERFQEFEPNGCFVARCDGELAGTATSIAYEKLFGWVGMVLVHENMRRRGLGRALLMAGIEYLEEQGVAAVKLDATPMGKQLYDTIGFVDEYLVERWQGRGGRGSLPGSVSPPAGCRAIATAIPRPSARMGGAWRSAPRPAIWSPGTPMGIGTCSCMTAPRV